MYTLVISHTHTSTVDSFTLRIIHSHANTVVNLSLGHVVIVLHCYIKVIFDRVACQKNPRVWLA